MFQNSEGSISLYFSSYSVHLWLANTARISKSRAAFQSIKDNKIYDTKKLQPPKEMCNMYLSTFMR